MNCLRERHSSAVIMKKCSDHEMFIMKIYIHVIFSMQFHKNLELYTDVCYKMELIYVLTRLKGQGSPELVLIRRKNDRKKNDNQQFS